MDLFSLFKCFIMQKYIEHKVTFLFVGPQTLLSPTPHHHHNLLSETTTFEFGEFSSRTFACIHRDVCVHISWGHFSLGV